MAPLDENIHTLAEVAADWRDPDHPRRAKARAETLDAPNRWTEQALTHVLNRWMQRLTMEGLTDWLGEEAPSAWLRVGVLHAESGPLAGLRDALAAWALGHEYVGHVPESSPAILPAVAEDAVERGLSGSIQFRDEADVLAHADVVLAQPSESPDAIREACDEAGIPPDRRLIRSPVYSIGVVDGHESEDEMERMAEDMLLFEGLGRRRLALLWAPADHSPDAVLQAMARFRGLFPAHPDTPGTLQMQQAFLEAHDDPHAYADGLEFLVSRGEPEPQRPGHVRWTEYESLEEVEEWAADHDDALYRLIARPGLHDQLPAERIRSPGGVHVPPLDDEDGREGVAFLREGERG